MSNVNPYSVTLSVTDRTHTYSDRPEYKNEPKGAGRGVYMGGTPREDVRRCKPVRVVAGRQSRVFV